MDLEIDSETLRQVVYRSMDALHSVTAERNRLRDENRQLREWNNELAAEIFGRQAAA